MAKERSEDGMQKVSDLKTLVLLHRPEVYGDVFKDAAKPKDDEVDWLVPRTEEEFEEVRDLMTQMGLG